MGVRIKRFENGQYGIKVPVMSDRTYSRVDALVGAFEQMPLNKGLDISPGIIATTVEAAAQPGPRALTEVGAGHYSVALVQGENASDLAALIRTEVEAGTIHRWWLVYVTNAGDELHIIDPAQWAGDPGYAGESKPYGVLPPVDWAMRDASLPRPVGGN